MGSEMCIRDRFSVIFWGFSLFLHHSSTEFSKRVNRPLGKRGTSVSTSFRLSKGLRQLGTIPRETFPAGRELSLQPLQVHMLKSYPFHALGISSFRKPFSDSSNFMEFLSPLNGRGIIPVLSWNTEQFTYMSSLIMCPIFLPSKEEGTGSYLWYPAVPSTGLYK